MSQEICVLNLVSLLAAILIAPIHGITPVKEHTIYNGAISIERCESSLWLTQQPDRAKENIPKSQWELKVRNGKLLEVQENASDHVTNGVTFGSDYWKSGSSFLDQSHKFKFKANMDITVKGYLLYQRDKLSLAIV